MALIDSHSENGFVGYISADVSHKVPFAGFRM